MSKEQGEKRNNGFAFVVVLFILLVIVGASGYGNQGTYDYGDNYCGGGYGGGWW
ncbi:YjcZ family sporulation protein [Ornithinibacillus gellani]|uniref:YjcZ family sporulation protein n=1 Tax=Ornithinibacillus gellani TaxID=2293253 RepID=UPI000F475A50|nr:YjcZ family sporulation protein [Ornithinibacillus gellani]TQS76581.1 YjcZ family sporulation protein [Ornithinibacillus gellani]